MILEVLEGLWSLVVNMIVTIPLDNELSIFYVIANFLLQIFGVG